MMKVQRVGIETVYVPTARRKTLRPDFVEELAGDILENGMNTPIHVRLDGARYVLIEGLHRLEAARMLGETAIDAYLVQARKH